MLLGCRRALDPAQLRALETAATARPGALVRRELHGLAEAGALRVLVDECRFNRVLIVAADDWLRPDLLYRYDLVRTGEAEPNRAGVTSAARPRTAAGAFLPPSAFSQDPAAQKPLLFDTAALESGVQLPRAALDDWCPADDGAAWEAVAHAARRGWPFAHVPVPMRARVARRPSAPLTVAGLRRHYATLDGGWRIDDDGRVRPPPADAVGIAVVVPYRDRRELTLRCFESVVEQKRPGLELVAVDNGSADGSIARSLSALGVRVVRRDETFNFSRLCNAGAATTRAALLLFLNNDAALAPGALAELAAWAAQPCVGLVAGRLDRRDGSLQHGGVEVHRAAPAYEAGWEDVEWSLPEERLERARRLRVVEAVSAACAMTRRAVFERIGGFDERHYPVAFGDLDYATRVRRQGLLCVYTPYARGLHEEGASRRSERLEDFEGSAWWARRLGRTP